MYELRGCIREFKEITLSGYIHMYTGVHSDVARETELFIILIFFDMPFDIPLEC